MTEDTASSSEEDIASPEEELEAAPPHKGIEGKRGGCLIAFLGAMLIGGGSIGLSYWLLHIKNEPVLAASSELAAIIDGAEKAPGTSALRDAGCDHAGVFELAALKTIAQRLEDGQARKEHRQIKVVDVGDERSVVACSMKRQQTPTCEELAHTYASAAKPGASFTVWITNLNGDVCAEEYTQDGSRVGPSKKPNLPPLD